jgi:radical SAM mobile pair protein A
MSIIPIKKEIKNINIVIGCPIGCRYCYARANNNRFHAVKDFSKPEFFENKLQLMDTKTPKTFFLTGQSDFAYWQPEWVEKVFNKIADNPQNNYIFLTKCPEKLKIETDLSNAWFGVTVTCAAEKERITILRNNIKAKHYLIAFEPMSDYVGELDLSGIEWLVIGTEIGNCKGKIPTHKSWVNGILEQAQALNIAVFMKEDLSGIIEESKFIQSFPKKFKFGD